MHHKQRKQEKFLTKVETRDTTSDKFAKPVKWCSVDWNGRRGQFFRFTPQETNGSWERVIDHVEALSYEGNTNRIHSKIVIYMSDGSFREIRGFFADPFFDAV